LRYHNVVAWIGVPDAAARLGLDVSRIRALAKDGELDAQRVGSRWIIDEAAIERYSAARPHRRAGRPFEPKAAWALLALAGDRPVDWLPSAVRERLVGILSSRDFGVLVGQLRRRAEVERWYVHPSLIERLVGEDGVLLGGARASRELARDPGPAEVYVRSKDMRRLRKAYSPAVDPEEHNVVVRIVDEPWPFEPDERVVWPVVAAVDLLDSHPEDPRSRAVAERILDRIDA
jgi:excisionase family DNA binding protein